MLGNPKLDPKESALLVIDMQNEFLRPDGPLAKSGLLPVKPADRKEFTANAKKLIQAMRNIGQPVVYVNTAFRPDHQDCFFSDRWHDAIVSDSSCLVEGSTSAAVIDELKPKNDDLILTKKGHSAFHGTYLDRLLKNLKVETCVLVGNILGSFDDTMMQGAALGYEFAPIADASYPLNSPDFLKLHPTRAFTPDTAEVLAWIKEGPAEPTEKKSPMPALIIVDIQNDGLHPDGANAKARAYHHLEPAFIYSDKQRNELIQNNLKLAAAMRARGFPVVYIQSTRGRHPADTAAAKTSGSLRVRPHPPGVDFLIEGTWGDQIIDELKPQPDDFVVKKRGHSGFGTTNLHRLLRNLGVDTIIVTGGANSGCAAATLREGVSLGYHAILIPDATYPPELDKRAISAAALASRGKVKSTEEMVAELKSGALVAGKSR